ncbi:hypothetical protein H632_c279p3 [Helicosporidium sp. ATCC 50920]|nr:hypothetical protein H632_c279p3 [Helicosporidium sp. ATCC 50920]|eukprot:KDD76298.1 hypothetical protein H632_c279p3 [Helicosporidium sp. ATCC 50920]
MAASEATDAEFVWPEPDVLGALENAQIVPYKSSVPGMKRYVAYFVHRYVEYRLPEVEAAAGLCPGKCLHGVICGQCPRKFDRANPSATQKWAVDGRAQNRGALLLLLG